MQTLEGNQPAATVDQRVELLGRHVAVPTSSPSRVVTVCFVSIMCLWLLLPFAAAGQVAQDAIPYVAAGQLVSGRPHDIYAIKGHAVDDVTPGFRTRYCEIADLSGKACRTYAVAFIATPLALPLAMILGHADWQTSSLFMRLLAACSLVAGMWIIWRRLAGRTPNAAALLVVSALVLTPMAMIPIGFGQTSPLLFLSVCLGMGSSRTRNRIISAVVWAATIAFKAFPALLVAVIIACRRWRFLVATLAILVPLIVLTLVVAPPSIVTDFLGSTMQVGSVASPHQSSIFHLVATALGGSEAARAISASVCLLVASVVFWLGLRTRSDRSRWAMGFVAALVVTPVVWWHYLWVVLGAVAVLLADQRKLTDRLVIIFPIISALTLIPSDPFSPHRGKLWLYQSIFMVGGVVIVGWLAERSGRGRVSGGNG